MICILCLLDRPGTREHVFADAIGGSIVIDRVCSCCNPDAGSTIEAALLNHVLVLMRRSQLRLVPRSGKTPNPFPVGTLADDPGQTVYVNYGAPGETPKIRFRGDKRVTREGADATTRYVVDDPSADNVAKIINRHRRREGLPELAGDALDAEIARSVSTRTIVNPTVSHQIAIDMFRFRTALLKIAYELAWRWLGDVYLEDRVAGTIRDLLRRGVPAEPTNAIPVEIGVARILLPDDRLFTPWADEPNLHVAMMRAEGDALWILVRVFDVFGGAFCITRNAERYRAVGDRFLGIDPTSGAVREHSVDDEIRYKIRTPQIEAP